MTCQWGWTHQHVGMLHVGDVASATAASLAATPLCPTHLLQAAQHCADVLLRLASAEGCYQADGHQGYEPAGRAGRSSSSTAAAPRHVAAHFGRLEHLLVYTAHHASISIETDDFGVCVKLRDCDDAAQPAKGGGGTVALSVVFWGLT